MCQFSGRSGSVQKRRTLGRMPMGQDTNVTSAQSAAARTCGHQPNTPDPFPDPLMVVIGCHLG